MPTTLEGDRHEPFCELPDPDRPDLDKWAPDFPVHGDPLNPEAGCPVYRHFGRAQLLEEMCAAGFTPVLTDPVLTDPDRPEYGIIKGEVFVGRKA